MTTKAVQSKFEARPLYARVREALIERIRSGVWAPGAALPNEFDLARELGVSQGTVRKALNALTAEHLLERHQGRGTFVVEQTPAHVLFRFFNLHDDATGQQIPPECRDTSVRTGKATRIERARLSLENDARVIRIARLRLRRETPFVAESIILPDALFPKLAEMEAIPNTLYDLFQRSYGITVARADERLTAVAANAREARQLAIEPGTPLLKIDRVIYSIDDKPLEWRISRCHLDGAHYLSRLK